MRIAIFTIGTEGDVRPLVALSKGLQAQGHSVTIATDPGLAALVLRHGVGYAPLNGDFLSWMREDQKTLKRGLVLFSVMAEAKKRLLAMAENWAEQGLDVARGADLLIGNGMVYLLAQALGQKLGVPVVETQLMPTLPSHQPPPLPLPKQMQNLPGPFNQALGYAARLLVWRSFLPAYNLKLRPALGLSPLPGWQFKVRDDHVRLFGYSAALIKPPTHWPSKTLVTGAWIVPEGETFMPPPALSAFLAAGPAPIYIGFGSMVHHDPQGFTAMVLEAVTRTGKRAVLASGWGGLSEILETRLGRDILVVERAPHDWLFPQMALCVHHGGVGTTTAAARAGIPQVVTPVFGDQPFWAARMQALGVAPAPLPRTALTAESLAGAIAAADRAAMRGAAKKLGFEMAGENGVETAISALKRFGLLM